jgi:DNA-binding transcriptional regulator YiaG
VAVITKKTESPGSKQTPTAKAQAQVLPSPAKAKGLSAGSKAKLTKGASQIGVTSKYGNGSARSTGPKANTSAPTAPATSKQEPSKSRHTNLKTTGPVAAPKSSHFTVTIRKRLGLTQDLFARLIGVTQRSIAGWEKGGPMNEISSRRVKEMGRLADELRRSMKAEYIPTWLQTPNESLGGLSPMEAMQRGEHDRLWRTVFLLGSGIPI